MWRPRSRHVAPIVGPTRPIVQTPAPNHSLFSDATTSALVTRKRYFRVQATCILHPRLTQLCVACEILGPPEYPISTWVAAETEWRVRHAPQRLLVGTVTPLPCISLGCAFRPGSCLGSGTGHRAQEPYKITRSLQNSPGHLAPISTLKNTLEQQLWCGELLKVMRLRSLSRLQTLPARSANLLAPREHYFLTGLQAWYGYDQVKTLRSWSC